MILRIICKDGNVNNETPYSSCTLNYCHLYFCCTVTCGTLGKAEKCERCPKVYQTKQDSCSSVDCGYLYDYTCVKKGIF